jgi:hypothetical protein
MVEMFYYEPEASQRTCTGKLLCIWGVYAIAMSWLWNGLTAAGFPALSIWAAAGVAGVLVLAATREI